MGNEYSYDAVGYGKECLQMKVTNTRERVSQSRDNIFLKNENCQCKIKSFLFKMYLVLFLQLMTCFGVFFLKNKKKQRGTIGNGLFL